MVETTVTESNIAKWTKHAFDLNEEYRRLIGSTKIQQKLNRPASEQEISELEKALKVRLPPSYRYFLGLHNGWRFFEGNVHLLSTAEQILGEYAEDILRLRAEYWEEGEVLILEGIIVGIELNANKAVILDPASIKQNGEMDVVFWQGFETERESNFLRFLQNQAINLKMLIYEKKFSAL